MDIYLSRVCDLAECASLPPGRPAGCLIKPGRWPPAPVLTGAQGHRPGRNISTRPHIPDKTGRLPAPARHRRQPDRTCHAHAAPDALRLSGLDACPVQEADDLPEVGTADQPGPASVGSPASDLPPVGAGSAMRDPVVPAVSGRCSRRTDLVVMTTATLTQAAQTA